MTGNCLSHSDSTATVKYNFTSDSYHVSCKDGYHLYIDQIDRLGDNRICKKINYVTSFYGKLIFYFGDGDIKTDAEIECLKDGL